MKAGISTACLFPLDLEQSLHRLGERGVRFSECFFNTPSELKAPAVRRLKEAAAFYGMEIASIHSFHSEMETFYFFTNYKNRLEDGIEQYRRYFEAAAELGAKYLIFHGDYHYSREAMLTEEQSFENIHTLWSVGKEYGVELLHENVSRCKGGQPDYLRRLHHAIPEMGFVLDCKQALRSGHRPEEFVQTLGSSIRHVHLSDSLMVNASIEKDCLPPGKGNYDFERLFRLLKEQGADPSMMIELYSDSFETMEELVESCDFVQRKLGFVNNY